MDKVNIRLFRWQPKDMGLYLANEVVKFYCLLRCTFSKAKRNIQQFRRIKRSQSNNYSTIKRTIK